MSSDDQNWYFMNFLGKICPGNFARNLQLEQRQEEVNTEIDALHVETQNYARTKI